MLLSRVGARLAMNRWRYLAFVAGFFLFVAPFALASRAIYYLTGNLAEATLHTICLRMPIDWFFGGRLYSLLGSPVMTGFVAAAILITLIFGPLFCGWLCPVGAVSESISRAIPVPGRFRLRMSPALATSIRYGFFAGFVLLAVLVGFKLAGPQIGGVCCRYCASSVLQNLSYALVGDLSGIAYWHTGSILVLVGWLLIGGLLTAGGRGWCLFFCPLGALSGIMHSLGARLGLYRIRHAREKCSGCGSCKNLCPMWAIGEGGSVNKALCISCKECVNACPNRAYEYGRGGK